MTMNANTPARNERTRDDLPDGRNGRVVGENDDNVLESIGKAVIAPVEGADEGAEPADGARTPPQGASH
jgi:hypothetical protein